MKYGKLRALRELRIFDDLGKRKVSLVVLSGGQPKHRFIAIE